MSQRYVFPSIAGRKVGYTLHTDSMALWDSAYRTARALGAHFGRFETYGDGLAQHEFERVVTLDDTEDYFASLGAFMLERLDRPFEEDEARRLYWCWPTRPSVEQIEFALSVVYKPEGKQRYFTMHGGDYKISARPSLEHDKRWHPIKDHHDGFVSGALSVLRAGERDTLRWALETWVQWEAVRQVLDKKGAWSPATASELLGLKKNDWESGERIRRVTAAFELAQSAFDVLGARLDLDCKLHNYRARMPKQEAQADAGDINHG